MTTQMETWWREEFARCRIECDRLREINRELVEALDNFSDMDTLGMGNETNTFARDVFLQACPEYIAHCKTARAALAKAKG